MISQFKGVIYAIACVLLYSVFSIFFKVISNYELHSLLFITISTMFASLILLIRGGYNKLMLEALTSLSTWIYAITFILIFVSSIELLKYISATEMILVSRLNILISLVFALLVLKRNNLGLGIYGLPLIIAGLGIVFYNIENSFYYVLALSIGSAAAKSAYFFSIELNKAGNKSKHYLDDFGILGFVLGLSAILCLIFMIIGSIISYQYGIQTRVFPTIEDFSDPLLFILAALYGIIGFTAIRYLEFKSVQAIKSEIFLCLITLVPLITLAFESIASYTGIIDSQVNLSPMLLSANLLIVAGGLLIVILRVLGQELTDESDKAYLVKMARSAEIFANNSIKKAALVLGTSEDKLTSIINNEEVKILKTEFKSIQNNFNKNIAMADHLTGLVNRLEFTTQLNHIDKNSSASLFFIDLNKFKPVNDKYGHDAGDFILHGIARRLEDAFSNSLLTRLGGDEFCLLIKNITKEESQEYIELINNEIEKEFLFNDNSILVSASIGIANYPEDTTDTSKLVKIADSMMYNNKDSYCR